MFSPSCFMLLRWRCWNPSPMATISTIDATPHAIPAMVRKLRSLFRIRLETTCPSSSLRWVIMRLRLLEDDLLALVQAAQDLSLRTVADARGDSHSPLAFLG